MAFQQTGHTEDISHVIVDDESFLACQYRIGFLFLFQHLAFLERQLLVRAMQEEGRFGKQAFRRSGILDDDRLRKLPKSRLLFR